MAKATYRGPGDAVELDGLRIERDKSTELTREQIIRIRASDPYALVDVDPKSEPETPRELVRIRAEQDEAREEAADAREREEAAAATAAAKAERDAHARATKRAAERDKVRAESVRELAELRSTPVKTTTRKEAS